MSTRSTALTTLSLRNPFRRLNLSLYLGMLLVLGIGWLAVNGANLAPKDPLQQNQIIQHEGVWHTVPLRAFEVPQFPLGTDQFGRDLFSQLLWAVRPTMIMISLVAIVRLVAGMGIGLVAGWSGGRAGRLLDSLISAALSVPVLIVALGVLALIGVESGLTAFIVGLSITGWADTARLVREQTRQIKTQLYIEAAHSLGADDAYILFKHILRQVMPLGWMLFAFEISATLLVTAGLGFLGYYIGGDVFIQTTDSAITRTSGLPELGQMLATSWISLTEPWGLFASGLMVLLIVLAFNLLGQGLRQLAGQTTRTGLVNRMQDRFGGWIEEHITYPAGRRMGTRAGRLILGSTVIALIAGVAATQFIINPGRKSLAAVVLTVPGDHLWGADRHDPYGTLWTSATGPETSDIAWQFTDQTGYTGGMVIDAQGTVYLASQGGRLYALLPDGQMQWMAQVANTPVGAPALDADGNVLVTDNRGMLSSFAPDGTMRWRYDPQNPNSANAGPIAGPDGTVYYATGSLVRAISPDGEALWQADTREFNLPPTPPRLSPDGQFVLIDDVAIRAADGSVAELDSVREAAEGTNTQFARQVYMVDPAGRAYLTSRNVAAQWASADGVPEIVTRITWDPSLTVFGDPADAGVTPSQVVWRMFTANARFDTILQWIDASGVALGNVQFTHRPTTVIAVDGNDTLYTCGPDRVQQNQMGCLSWSKGEEEANWILTLESPAIALGGALVEGRLYVVSSAGALIAIGNATGPELALSAPPYGQTAQNDGQPASENGNVPDETPSAPVTIDDFFNASYGELLLRNPELVSELGLSDQFGIEDNTLTDISLGYQSETIDLAQAQLDALAEWDFDALADQEQISYLVYQWYLQDMIEGEAYELYAYPYNHLFGWHTGWVDFMTTSHPLATRGDIQGYIARLGLFNAKVDQMIAFMDAQRALGIQPPRLMLEYVLGQVQNYVQPAGEHVLLTSFQTRMAASSTFTSAQTTRFETQVQTAITTSVLPGYRKLGQYLEGWLAEVTLNQGLGEQPGGVEAYNYWLSHHTTTDMTAEEIHQLGLSEVARITAEMEGIFEELGIVGETMADKIGQVAAASGFVNGEEAVVETYTQLIEAAETDFVGYFDTWPETEMEVIAFNSPISPGAFYTYPSLDGAQPGRFYVNVSGGQYAFSMPTLAYHEGMPGHHYQIALQQEIEGLPYFRNGVNFTAYAEGWALYAEYVAWEAGIYDDNPYGDMGRLQGELFRAARLVVDTGLHAYGWTREEAIQYMVDILGWGNQAAIAEVDRYLAWPGQATAYKVGMLKILELRQRAIDALGAEFDIVEFHNLVVGNGAMPLEVLEVVVEEWIEEKSGS